MVLAVPALLGLAAPPGTAAAPGASEKSLEALLELRHPRGLNRFVRAVSDPASPRYRRYASVEKLVARFGASAADRNAKLAWLERRDLRGTIGPTGTYVTVPISRRRAAACCPSGGRHASQRAPRWGAPSRPGCAGRSSGHGPHRTATTSSPGPAPPATATRAAKPPYSSILPHCGTARGCAAGRIGPGGAGQPPFTPNQYLTAYGHAAMHRRGLHGEGQTVALVEVGGFRRADIDAFAECFGVEPPPIQVIPVQPLSEPLPGGSETTLDLEMLTVGAPGVERIDVYEGVANEAGIVLTAGTALGAPGNRPDVISISLGICEPKYSAGTSSTGGPSTTSSRSPPVPGSRCSSRPATQGSSGCRGHGVREHGDAAARRQPARLLSLRDRGGRHQPPPRRREPDRSEVVWNDWLSPPGRRGRGQPAFAAPPWWQKRRG